MSGAERLVILDTTTTPDVIYRSVAPIGTKTSEPKWQLQKIVLTDGIDIYWADGDANADNIHDDRASKTYSH